MKKGTERRGEERKGEERRGEGSKWVIGLLNRVVLFLIDDSLPMLCACAKYQHLCYITKCTGRNNTNVHFCIMRVI